MIKVYTSGIAKNINRRITAKVHKLSGALMGNKDSHALLVDSPHALVGEDVNGYALVLSTVADNLIPIDPSQPIIHSIDDISHLNEGDIISCDKGASTCRTVYLRGSPHNVIFTTLACNSNCLMCSQPPRDVDPKARLEEILDQIHLFDPDTNVMCITGGEPTLMGECLFRIIAECRDRYPAMKLHILTNGRNFSRQDFADEYASLRHPDLMAGIPVYSDVDYLHDYVVQAKGAFWETVAGIHNLGKLHQKIEIRIVIHKETYKRLPQLAEFLYRNMPFVNHITFMGMEIVGYAKANLTRLWIDPFDYQDQLEVAVLYLARLGMNVSIYNHQLCVLRKNLWKFARTSISDWKNAYDEECSNCDARMRCGGFFQWNPTVRSQHIRRITLDEIASP